MNFHKNKEWKHEKSQLERGLSLVLSLMLIVSVFAGCGNNGTASSTVLLQIKKALHGPVFYGMTSLLRLLNTLINIAMTALLAYPLAILPILVVFPFLQKYYSKGITLGAVKG